MFHVFLFSLCFCLCGNFATFFWTFCVCGCLASCVSSYCVLEVFFCVSVIYVGFLVSLFFYLLSVCDRKWICVIDWHPSGVSLYLLVVACCVVVWQLSCFWLFEVTWCHLVLFCVSFFSSCCGRFVCWCGYVVSVSGLYVFVVVCLCLCSCLMCFSCFAPFCHFTCLCIHIVSHCGLLCYFVIILLCFCGRIWMCVIAPHPVVVILFFCSFVKCLSYFCYFTFTLLSFCVSLWFVFFLFAVTFLLCVV